MTKNELIEALGNNFDHRNSILDAALKAAGRVQAPKHPALKLSDAVAYCSLEQVAAARAAVEAKAAKRAAAKAAPKLQILGRCRAAGCNALAGPGGLCFECRMDE